jgi:hypothetical protein
MHYGFVSYRVLTFVHTTINKGSEVDTRIQFRVGEETKRLAQQMAESQGRTLSDACRDLTEQLADQQRKAVSHDAWLTEQVNLAFDRFDTGRAVFADHDQAKSTMAERKAKIRDRG